MANKKFSEFVDGGALQTNDIVVGLRSGVNTKFTATPNPTLSNTVFVAPAPSGSDVNGNGSFNKPYGTVAHAMTTITTATPTNTFNIVIMGGRIIETAPISLKPNIGIVGLGQEAIVVQASPMVLDATYLNAGSSATAITGLTLNGNIDLDFSTATNPAGHVIDIDGASVGSININSNSTVLPTLVIQSVGMANLTVNNCILLLYATTLGAFTAGNLPSTRQLSTIVVGNSISGAVDLQSETGAFNCLYFFRGNYLQNTVTLTNNRCFWHADVSSYKTPTVVNGATIVLDNISDGLEANFTPVNYTPTAPAPTLNTSVNAHLRGIDDALSQISSGENIVYVAPAPQGNDTTGNGSIGSPFATVAHAISTITTAAINNTFLVKVLHGTTAETAQIELKPFVSLTTDSESASVGMTSDLIMHSSWGTTASGSSYLENLRFTGGNLVFDFSSFSNSTTQTISLDDIAMVNLVVNSNINTVLVFKAVDCNMVNATLDNSICAFNLCYINSLNCGQKAIVRSSAMNFISGVIGAGAVVFQGAVSGGNVNQYVMRGCRTTAASLTIVNPNCSLDIDVSSFIVPTITNGAMLTLSSISNGLKGNYTPVNYTPDSTGGTTPVDSLAAHLHGIDNALSGSGSVSTRYIYVSSTGSNVIGNGSFDNPYATVAFAMNTITTASASNPFTIYLLGGRIAETAAISLKPFISITSASNSVILQMFSNMILHASWNTTVSPQATLSNFTITNADILFNGSSFTNASTSLIFMNDVIAIGRAVTIKGSANFDLELYANNCIYSAVNYSNAFVELNSCITASLVCNSGKADPALRTATGFFLGCRLGSVEINSLATGPATTANFWGNQIQSLTGDGAVVQLLIDSSSFVTSLTISNSATYVLTSKSSGMSADYTPVNYTPAATTPILASSIQGHLRGIDNALSVGVQDLQNVYNAGANANVVITAARSILFKNANESLAFHFDEDEYSVLGLSDAEPLFLTPPVPTHSTGADRIEGYTFTPTIPLFATKFQYKATAIPSGSREIGLWEFGNTTPLATGTVEFISNVDEDGIWRYVNFDVPVLLNTGTQYVVAAVIPASELFYFGTPTGINADITINGGADGPNSSTLVYPSSFGGVGVNGNASIGLSPTLPSKVLGINYNGIENIYSYKSLIYPAIISNPGFSLAVLNYGLYTRVGDMGQITAQITVTSSSTTGNITLAVPDTSAVFLDNFQCIGVGNIINPGTPTTAAAGIILTVFSVASTPFVRMNISVPSAAANYIIYVDFKYKLP